MDLGAITIKDLKIQIGQWAKQLRKREKLSQDELAKTLKLSRITVQNLESGKNITLDTLLKVLQHFDTLANFQAFVKEETDHHKYKSLY